VEEMDAGPVWATCEFNLPAGLRKSELYSGRVSDAAIRCIREVVEKFIDGFVPTPLDYTDPKVRGCLQPNMKQDDRTFSWHDCSRFIKRCIDAADGQPGVLRDLLGVRLQNFDSLRPGLHVTVTASSEDSSGQPVAAQAHTWTESYRLAGAQATHAYADGPLAGQPAVTRHGNVTVIGAHSEALVTSVLSDLLREAHLDVLPMPEGVRRSRRGGVTVIQNWTDRAVDWQGQRVAPYGSLLLGQAQEPETQTPEQVEAPYEQRR